MNHYPQQFHPIRVACRSGHSYADRPTSFAWKGELYEITKIEREWLEPIEKHFLARAVRENAAKSEKRFHICYHTQEDLWRLKELQ